jgi:uncharacterized protein (TIGR02145 family)
MKNIFKISAIILLILSVFIIHSCKKEKPKPPIITTTAASAITQTTATSGGNITSDGGANVTVHGVCWSTTTGPTTALSTKTTDNTGTGIFTSSITALTAGQVYYVRAYATNSAGTSYGNEVSFTTKASTLPVLTTTAASAITKTTATSGGNVTSDGGAAVTARGVCWSTTTGPTTSLSTKTTDGTGTGVFTSSITALTAGTVYYVRAYATNSAGTSYGNEISFTTGAAIPGAPTIGTATAGNAQATVAFTAPVSNGGSVITGYTVTSNPGAVTATGSASPITITGLTNGTTYTFTVTATNAIGTSVASSASNSVTPLTVPGIPTIGTASAGNSQAMVTFTAPGSNGGSAITGYTVTSSPGGLTGIGTASPITVSGLTNGTTYTFTVTATNAIGASVASSASNSVTPLSPITDIDGNVYNIVTIGTQVWMKENLKTTKYNDGTTIPNITDNTAWVALTTGAYINYYNTPANSTTYGRLYNWYTVDNNAATKVASNGGKNVCPTGWHVPTYAEWTTLSTYLGDGKVALGKLKESGTSHWISNFGATNESGFTALPGGWRISNSGAFDRIGISGSWWTATPFGGNNGYLWYMDYDWCEGRYSDWKYGFSVRCVRDF